MRAFTIIVFLALVAQVWANSIPLSQIQSLTLYKGQYTIRHRTPVIPQLQCQGGSAGCQYIPDVVQCSNMGSDGHNINWKCEGRLPDGVDLGSIHVSCEGYRYPGDPEVLVGSCGLKFTLDRTSYKQSGPNVETIESVTTTVTTFPDAISPTAFLVLLLVLLLFCICLGVCDNRRTIHAPSRIYTSTTASSSSPTVVVNDPPVIVTNPTPAVVTHRPSPIYVHNPPVVYNSYPSTYSNTYSSVPVRQTTTTTTVRGRSGTTTNSNSGTHTSTGYGTSSSD